MARLFSNNAITALASGISDSGTSLSVNSGDGALFPNPSGGDSFRFTIREGSKIEICDCTARAGDSFSTITRAQEGTSAQSFTTAAQVYLSVTAATLAAIPSLSEINSWSAQQKFANGAGATPSIAFISDPDTGLHWQSSGVFRAVSNSSATYEVNNQALVIASAKYIGWNIGAASEPRLYRDAANTLALRNGINAQQFNIYKTDDGAGNAEYLRVLVSGDDFMIRPNATGTGVNRSLAIGPLSPGVFKLQQGGADRWNIIDGGDLVAQGNYHLLAGNGTSALPGLSFKDDPDSGFYKPAGNAIGVVLGGTELFRFFTSYWRFDDVMELGWGLPVADVRLFRDDAGILAQRNGSNAQKYHLYETFTDTFNYARLVLYANSSGHQIYTDATGSGTIRDLKIGHGLGLWTFAQTVVTPPSDNAHDLGASATRIRRLYLGTDVVIGTNAAATGVVRIPNDAAMLARNQANDNDVLILKITTANLLQLGAAHNTITSETLSGYMQIVDSGGTIRKVAVVS